MELSDRKLAFVKLGKILDLIATGKPLNENDKTQLGEEYSLLQNAVAEANLYNGWFTENMVKTMFAAIASSLTKKNLDRWLKPYQPELIIKGSPKTIAVVMAGNIPLVGFHDLLCVLISGNILLAKLSSDDNKLMPALVGVLKKIEPGFNNLINFTDEKIRNFDAIIATGSNNSSRYFDFYFGKYRNIIRKNRNGVAVLTGEESDEELKKLTDDIFLYYGMGCRNVSKIYVPEGYNFDRLIQVLKRKEEVVNNNKYFNNYEYNKAIYLVNGTPHFDAGNILLTENNELSSPLSVLYYEFYHELDSLKIALDAISPQIQCVVAASQLFENRVEFGKSQHPNLWDYADGVDTLEFLLSIEKEKDNTEVT